MAYLIVDGHTYELGSGADVSVIRSDIEARLVERNPETSIFSLMVRAPQHGGITTALWINLANVGSIAVYTDTRSGQVW